MFETVEARDTNQKAYLLAEAEAAIVKYNEDHIDDQKPLMEAVALQEKWLLRYEDYSSSRHKETSKQCETKRLRRAEARAVSSMDRPHREVHPTTKFDPSSSSSSSSSPAIVHKGKRPREEEESESNRIIDLEVSNRELIAEVQQLRTQLADIINMRADAEINRLRDQVELYHTKYENAIIAAAEDRAKWVDDTVAHKKESVRAI